MKIEVGKYYRTGNGDKVGPMRESGNEVYPFYAGGEGYTEDGKIVAGVDTYGYDLIAEWTEPDWKDVTDKFTDPDPLVQNPHGDYAHLVDVLNDAYQQAANGKGKVRHANNRPFVDQPIMQNGRKFGPGFNLGQATKKIEEGFGMLARGERDAAEREFLGAINYVASAILLVRENKPRS